MDPIFLSVFKPDLQYSEYPDLIKKLDQRMQPGACSQTGFNAVGEKLVDVCQKDALFLKNKKITHEQIADRLEAVLVKAQFLFRQSCSRSDYTAFIGQNIAVPSYFSTCGEQECPFSKDLNNPKTWCGTGTSSIKIINTLSKKCLNNITELHVHLIRDHHYFEGNTEYRLDPQLAIEVLEIKPGIDYQSQVIGSQAWKGIAYEGPFNQETLFAAKENKIEDFQSESGEFEAYLLPYKDFSSYKYRGLTHKQKIEKEGLENKKSKEQIDKDIEVYIEFEKMFKDFDDKSIDSTINEQIWQSDGNNYLHVFTFKQLLDKNRMYNIGNAVISSVDIRPSNELTIYKSIKSNIPVLEKDDCVK